MTQEPTPPPAPVTVADREAAADIYRRFRYGATVEIQAKIRREIERGERDTDPIVQAFALHRLRARGDVLEEASAIAIRPDGSGGHKVEVHFKDYAHAEPLFNALSAALANSKPVIEGE